MKSCLPRLIRLQTPGTCTESVRMAGPSRLDDGSVTFDVVKVNMFGSHQPRKIKIKVVSDAKDGARG